MPESSSKRQKMAKSGRQRKKTFHNYKGCEIENINRKKKVKNERMWIGKKAKNERMCLGKKVKNERMCLGNKGNNERM